MVKSSDLIVKKAFLGTLVVMILSSLTVLLGMLIDGIVIRKCLGAKEMAAYGIAGPVFFLLAAVANIFSSGTQTICARSLGRGDVTNASKCFSTTIVTILLLSVILIPGFFYAAGFLPTLLGVSGEDQHLAKLVSDYIKGLSLGIPVLCFSSLFTSLLHLEGRKNLAFLATVIGSAVNVAGDFLCVYVFHGGMFGMALATSFSYLVSSGIMLTYYLQGKSIMKFSPRKAARSFARETAGTGLPSALSNVCMMLRTVVYNWLILTISTQAALSAYSIRTNMNNLYGAVGLGIGMTTLVIGGVVVGEGSLKDTRQLMKTAIKYSLEFNFIVCALIIVFAKQLVGIYTTDPIESAFAVRAFYFSAISAPLATVNLVFMNYFQATKNMKLAHLVCLLDNFVYSCLAATVLGYLFGINGVWAAVPVGEILMMMTIYFLAWKHTGHMPRCLEDLLFLPKDFDVPQEDRLECSCQNMESVVDASKAAYDFVLQKCGDREKANLIALCIEELAGNVIRWGFESEKKNAVDIRITYRGQFTLRFRDNCKPFDPKKWLELNQLPEKDPSSNLGIRMTVQRMEDIQYMSTLKLNHLLIKL
ncbi:MAG: MATE family efflux transporter [Aristaeellaceae bacterium]